MGLFDRFYYGKAGQRDYTEANMPKDRFSLFLLVLKDHLFDLAKVNFLQLIFWIPFIVWSYINLAALQGIGADEEMELAEIAQQLYGFITMWLIGLIPCIAITGPSSAGAAYVMRNWARDQHAFLWSDFKDAFKANWKHALGVSTITAFIPLIVYTAVTFYAQMTKEFALLFIPLGIVLMLLILYTLMLPLLYPLMVGYELSFKNIYRNALLIASASLPIMILSRLITFIPIALLFVGIFTGNAILIMIMSLYYVFFGFAFSRLVYASFANGLFDKYLNPKIEGAPIGQGLRPADYEDEDDIDDEDDEEEEPQENRKDERPSGSRGMLHRLSEAIGTRSDADEDDDDEDDDDDV